MKNSDIERIKETCAIVVDGQGGFGTGYLIAPQWLVTAWHVVRAWKEAEPYEVQLGWGRYKRAVWATLHRIDRTSDAAVLRLQAPVDDLVPLSIRLDVQADDIWRAFGFPGVAKRANGLQGVPMNGTVLDPHLQDSEGTATLALRCADAMAGNAASVKGWSGSAVVIDGAITGHLVRYIPDPDDALRPAFGQLRACPIAAVLKLLDNDVAEELSRAVDLAPSTIYEKTNALARNFSEWLFANRAAAVGEQQGALSTAAKSHLDFLIQGLLELGIQPDRKYRVNSVTRLAFEAELSKAAKDAPRPDPIFDLVCKALVPYPVAAMQEPKRQQVGLSLVSAVVVEPEEYADWPRSIIHFEKHPFGLTFLPHLDFTFRNTGPVAVLKLARFHVRKVWLVKNIWQPAFLRSSWTYSIELPVDGAPYTKELMLHQSIGQGESDRFKVVLKNNSVPTYDMYIYDLSIDFVYNDDEILGGPRLTYLTAAEVLPLAQNSGVSREVVFQNNIQVAREISGVQAKYSRFVADFVQEWTTIVDCFAREIYEYQSENDRDGLLNAIWLLQACGPFAKPVLSHLNLLASTQDEDIAKAAKSAVAEIEASSLPEQQRFTFLTERSRRQVSTGSVAHWLIK